MGLAAPTHLNGFWRCDVVGGKLVDSDRHDEIGCPLDVALGDARPHDRVPASGLVLHRREAIQELLRCTFTRFVLLTDSLRPCVACQRDQDLVAEDRLERSLVGIVEKSAIEANGAGICTDLQCCTVSTNPGEDLLAGRDRRRGQVD
eukprot:832479-Prymnesium_polylepis.2